MRRTLFLLFLFISTLTAQEPSALYLTYLHDPATSITIQWHTEHPGNTLLTYGRENQKTDLPARGMNVKIPENNLYVHTVELLNLKPDTTYHFTINNSTQRHTFRTLPSKLTRDVRVIIGGDAYQQPEPFFQMNRTIAALDPDFVIIGGDIAYAEGIRKLLKGKNATVRRWQEFFAIITQTFHAPDGRIIPLIPVIGNHDIKEKQKEAQKPPLLFQFMAFPRTTTTYRPLDLGAYCSFLLLDTHHFHPIDGKQKVWLEAALHSRDHIPALFPVYHIAAYPSYHSYDAKESELVRSTWVPLFEKYPISAAFENHNHIYKRTHPLLQGKPHPDGILYLGDGAWSVPPRNPKSHPYLATTKKINSIWLIHLSPSTPHTLTSYDITGAPIETLPLPKRHPFLH